jgi:hypothetical protein
MNGAPSWMPVLGGIVLVCVAGYYGFQAFDRFGVPTQKTTGTVTGKEYKPAHMTYTTDIINGRAQTMPRSVPDIYAVFIRTSDGDSSAAVDRKLYNELSNGDRIAVTYKKRRLTGAMEIVGVSRE